MEQVTIDNPAAGNYSLTVFGFSVPSGPQAFAVSYDIVSTGLQITYPIGGEKVLNTDSIRIFWDGPTDGNTFTVQFSSNGGSSSWTTLSATVACQTCAIIAWTAIRALNAGNLHGSCTA